VGKVNDVGYPLHSTQLSVAALLKQSEQWKDSMLGAFCFSAEAVKNQIQAAVNVPCMGVAMQRLDAGDSVCEVWHGRGQLTRGQSGAIHYCYDEGALLGVIELPEALFADIDKTPLQQATESAYRQIFALLERLRYPYLFRCWNYIADINVHSFGLERYRQFNLGRQDAFLAHGRDVTGNVPAACAMGFGQTGLVQGALPTLHIAFLAGRAAPLNIENPRQISAYQYPQEYGPRSPTFSRASLACMGQDKVLFISGTASIVGHATLHPGNVVAQTRETIANIKAVLDEANRQRCLASQPKLDLASLYYTVYVRHPADLAQIRTELARCAGDALTAVYLQADMCREDLLLEIEATAVYPQMHMPAQRV